MDGRQAADGRIRKRKAENQDFNERLSKRLSLLNLERNGQKLYVPVEAPSRQSKPKLGAQSTPDNDVMQLDDTKHKVYIYNLDDELSDSDSSVDENKLVFIPDIEKHLRDSRIPASILANSDGEIAGRNMSSELVLYDIPSSLTLPEEKDSVRKAIIETRARAQEKQRREREFARTSSTSVPSPTEPMTVQSPRPVMRRTNGSCQVPKLEAIADNDPDAMDLD